MRSLLFSETMQVVRPICIFLVGIAVVACMMASQGWHHISMLLAAVIVLAGALLVIQVHRVVNVMKQRTCTIAEVAAQAERHYVEVFRGIVGFLERRDLYSLGHGERVGRLSEEMARRMGLDDASCSLMRLAGQLHDIGLLDVSENVLKKRSRMSMDGFRSVQHHPAIAYEVLKPLESIAPILPAILCHHERMNGTGYPDGLKGDQIPLEARILAVADSYDAMTHDRPHRSAMSRMHAMNELRRCSPAGYDLNCVNVLADIVNLPALQEAMACSTDGAR